MYSLLRRPGCSLPLTLPQNLKFKTTYIYAQKGIEVGQQSCVYCSCLPLATMEIHPFESLIILDFLGLGPARLQHSLGVEGGPEWRNNMLETFVKYHKSHFNMLNVTCHMLYET